MSDEFKYELAKDLGFYDTVKMEAGERFVRVTQVIWSNVPLN